MIERGTGRRRFLQATAGGAVSCGVLGGVLSRLAPVSAAESTLPKGAVRFDSAIEPLVRLIEETPRGKVIEEVASRVAAGRVSYQQLLAALMLAGVRNVQPRPSVGFKFHAVLVVNSAHVASLASADAERWLPLFWTLDNFKSAQARDIDEGDWTMAAVDQSSVPPTHKALGAFNEAMDRWDESAADVASAALARGRSAGEIFDAYARYAARDFRSIGHKVIYLSNAYRTLEAIGWQHAEPVLRSLSYAMLNHVGEPNPADSDLDADRDGRRNLERISEIREDWLDGKLDSGATTELMLSMRSVSSAEASRLVVEQLNRGVSPRSIYDGLFAASAEMTLRQPAIVPLHAMTTTNAIHYAFQTCSDDATRRYLLLQNASFIPRFRDSAKGRGKLADRWIDTLAAAEGWSEGDGPETIFKTLGDDPEAAASQMLAFVQNGQRANEVIDHGRRLIFLKGRDSHDYKYSSAVLEDYHYISPEWRDRYLAAALAKMRNETERTTSLVQRIGEALG